MSPEQLDSPSEDYEGPWQTPTQHHTQSLQKGSLQHTARSNKGKNIQMFINPY